MTHILTLPSFIVWPIALLLFLGPMVMSLLAYWLSKTNNSSKINKIVSKLFITPFPLEPLQTELSDDLNLSEKEKKLTRQLYYRLLLIYGGILLFLISNLIGEFYFLLADITQQVSQGSTGNTRIWSSFVFKSLFSGGWMGYLPWYGNLPLPPTNLASFHDTWSWVFFTAPLADNPAFLDNMVWGIIIHCLLFSLLFLIPLVFGPIRKLFLPSMFFFSTGMLTSIRGFTTCLSQVFQLEYFSGSITYGVLTITKTDLKSITNLYENFIIPLIFVMLIFFVFFLLLGRKIWRHHYPNHQYSHYWFMLYITLSFWGSLVIMMV